MCLRCHRCYSALNVFSGKRHFISHLSVPVFDQRTWSPPGQAGMDGKPSGKSAFSLGFPCCFYFLSIAVIFIGNSL